MKKIARLFVYRKVRGVASYIELGVVASIGLIFGIILSIVAKHSEIVTVKDVLSVLNGSDVVSNAIFFPMIGYIIGIFANVFIGIDFRNGTFRNMIISGYTRKEIYLSYYFISLIWSQIVSICYLAFYFIGASFGIGNYVDTGLDVGNFLSSIGLFSLVQLAVFTFIFFVIFKFKSGGFTIPFILIVYFVMFMIPTILSVVLTVQASSSPENITSETVEAFAIPNLFTYTGQISLIGQGNFSILGSTAGLPKEIAALIKPTRDWTVPIVSSIMGTNLLVIFGFFWWGISSFNKLDIK